MPGEKPGSTIDTDAGNFGKYLQGRLSTVPSDGRLIMRLAVLRIDHCIELVKQWHDLRLDLENSIYAITQDKTIYRGIAGSHKKEVFRGHCHGEGGANYTQIQGLPKTFERMFELYV